MLLTVLLVFLLLSVVGGGVSWNNYGAAGLGPAGFVLVLVVVLLLLGHRL